MTRNRWLLLLTGLIGGLLLSGRLVLLAQDGNRAVGKHAPPSLPQDRPAADGDVLNRPRPAGTMPPAREVVQNATNATSLQDALLRPYHFPFARPTPLNEVAAHLKQTLKAAVVLDLAALGRQDVEPEDPVQLDLDGVRLKTGLKLLLDQLGLTYHVVAEDNLMIITDREGSEDPNDRVWSELRALHRDLHQVQDDIDDLRDFLGDDREGGPRFHKPTIIEELPDVEGPKPGNSPDKPGKPQRKPGAGAPEAGARPAPSRVPL
jgi:hypothetical protein